MEEAPHVGSVRTGTPVCRPRGEAGSMPTSENQCCAGDGLAPRTCPPPGCGARTRRVSPRPPTAEAADRSFAPRGDVPDAGKGKGRRKSSGREGQSGTPSFSLSAAARFLVRSPAPARLPLSLTAPARSKCCPPLRSRAGGGRARPPPPALTGCRCRHFSAENTDPRPGPQASPPGKPLRSTAPRNCGCGKAA